MYRLRLEYSKQGDLIYISHLDMLRVFERSLKRANIVLKHSEGFNPRPLLTFAHPLSLGIESTGEICEVDLNDKIDNVEFMETLNEALPTGIKILSAEYTDIEKKSLMSKVYAAIYEIELSEDIAEDMVAFMDRESIMAQKKSKNSLKEVDLKLYIKEYKKIANNKVEVTLLIGSENNLKPELLTDTFLNEINKLDTVDYAIYRTKIFLNE